MNTFEELQSMMKKFVDERNWAKFHTPKNLSMSISIEAAELMEIFQWMTPREAIDKSFNDPEVRHQLKDEIADVIIYCLSLANSTDIDLKSAVIEKMDRNKVRFPPEHKLQ